MVNKKERQQLEDYVEYLLSKGYSKKQIKDHLIKKGFSGYLVRELIYPYMKVLVYSGILLILMIVIIAGVATFTLVMRRGSSDGGSQDSESITSVRGLSVSDVSVDEETGAVVVHLYNGADEVFPGGMNIKVYSGEFYLEWTFNQGILPGDLSSTSAGGFRLPERKIYVKLDDSLAYSKII